MTAPATLVVTATFEPPGIDVIDFALGDAPTALYTLEGPWHRLSLQARAPSTLEPRWAVRGGALGDLRPPFAVSPDESIVAFVRHHGSVDLVLLDRRGDRVKKIPRTDARRIDGLRWAPDGAVLVAWDGGTTARVIDVARGEVVDVLTDVFRRSLSADASRYVRHDTARGEEPLALVERRGRREVARWPCEPGHFAGQERVVVEEGGAGVWYLASGHDAFELRRYTADGVERRASLDVPIALMQPTAGGVVLLSTSGDLARVTVDGGGGLTVAWRGRAPTRLRDAALRGVRVEGNPEFAAFMLGDHFARYDLRAGDLHVTEPVAAGSVRHLAPAPDGRAVAAAWEAPSVAWLDAATLAPRMTFELEAPARACAVSADARDLHVLVKEGLVALRLDDGGARPTASLSTDLRRIADDAYHNLALSPDGRFALVTSHNGGPAAHLRVDLATGAAAPVPVAPGETVYGVCVLAQGERLCASVVDADPASAPRVVLANAKSGSTLQTQSIDDDLREPIRWNHGRASTWLTPSGDAVIVWEHHDELDAVLFHWVPSVRTVARVDVPRGKLVALDDRRAAWLEDSFDDERVLAVIDLGTMAITGHGYLPPADMVLTGCFCAEGSLLLGLFDGRILRFEPEIAAP